MQRIRGGGIKFRVCRLAVSPFSVTRYPTLQLMVTPMTAISKWNLVCSGGHTEDTISILEDGYGIVISLAVICARNINTNVGELL